ncbi:MAG: AMP-binding protein, partial [Terricaulis sp.]
MSDPVVIPVPEEWAKKAFVDDVKYRAMHASALADPEAFWGIHGQRLDWIKPYTKVKDTSFNEADFHIRWYWDGVLNVSTNCIDRHLEKRGDQVAIIWEGDDPHQSRHISYRELHDEVCRFANVLKSRGVTTVIVITRTGAGVPMHEGRDIVYEDAAADVSAECAPEPMNAEDPLFILYTSGSTGKPKGVLHTTGGYLVYASMTHQYVFDYHDGDIYWCTADVGWVTGHTYIVYGPLANGATTLMFEGVPNYPNVSRFWEVIDKHKVNIFYTAPTAIRALMRDGEEPVKRTSRSTLRLIGTVGEPINPEAWLWYYRTVGDSRCPVVDTWWQTET